MSEANIKAIIEEEKEEEANSGDKTTLDDATTIKGTEDRRPVSLFQSASPRDSSKLILRLYLRKAARDEQEPARKDAIMRSIIWDPVMVDITEEVMLRQPITDWSTRGFIKALKEHLPQIVEVLVDMFPAPDK